MTKLKLIPTTPTIGVYGAKDFFQDGHPGYTHDHNITVMQGGRVLAYLQLERLSRVKYDNRIDSHMEDLLISLTKYVDINNCDWVFADSFAGRSFISSNGRIRFDAPLYPRKLEYNVQEGIFWLKDLKRLIRKKGYSVSQETAHLASCLPFFGEFLNDSLLVHYDGGASISNFSAWHKKNNKIQLIESHWKLGKTAALFNGNPLAFNLVQCSAVDHSSLAGKLMGFSSVSHVDKIIHHWLVKNDFFFKDDHSSTRFLKEAKSKFNWKSGTFDTKDIFLQAVASSFQSEFEKHSLKKISALQSKGKWKNLYLTGGCALNIILNSKINQSELFPNIFIPPCCSDTGLSLGAASILESYKGHNIKTHSPYLNNVGLSETKVLVDLDTIKKIATLIERGEIIGISNGFAEVGPRALGNRSLIGRPDSINLRTKLSEVVKKREWYRPVAPIMLEENARKVTGLKEIPQAAKYMLMDFNIIEEYVRKMEGVIHFNGTSRIQAIFKRTDNPFMFELLREVDRSFGLIGLMNTSFNAQGEPIVHTPEQAIESAKKMNLNYVVINGKLIELF